MTWHQWHQTAPMSSRMGLSSALARSNSTLPPSGQSKGLVGAGSRIGLAESFRRFLVARAKKHPFEQRMGGASSASTKRGRNIKNQHRLDVTLLDLVAGAGVARVKGLASREAFVLAVIKTDAVLADLPAEIHVLVVDDGGKIEQADVEVLDQTAGFENAAERGLHRLGQLIVFHAEGRQFFVWDDYATHHHDARGYGREVIFLASEFFPAIHGLDEERFEFLTHTLRFGQGKEALRRLRSFVLLLIVVFVCHHVSVRPGARSGDKRLQPRRNEFTVLQNRC